VTPDDEELVARIRGFDRPKVLNPDWVLRAALSAGLELAVACVIAERTPCGPTTMAELFARLRQLQDQHGLRGGFRHYIGALGKDADQYADHAMARLAVWRERLKV
jgi:hypothetical protein